MIMPAIELRANRIIIDVDTQRYFFQDRCIVHIQNYRQVLANIRRVMAWARLKDIYMISTVQIYADNCPYYNFHIAGPESQRKISYTLRNRRTSFAADDCTDLPLGILRGPPFRNKSRNGNLRQYDQVIFYKRCFDPFEEPRADRMLTELEADEFILIGAVTEGAVKATALGLLARRKNVTILFDAIGSHNSSAARTALRHMWAKGANITDTRTFVGSCSLRLAGHRDRR